MSVLGINRLLELVNDPDIRLVENLSDRELNNPEGTGFDLRVGKLSRITDSEGYLGVQNRQTPEIATIAEWSDIQQSTVNIEPHVYYLATSIEIVNLPEDLVGIVRPRSTLIRSGILVLTSQINPGYRGQLSFGVLNATPFNFKLEMGARIVHLLLATIDGTSSPYRGQWQGGRIRTDSEEQI